MKKAQAELLHVIAETKTSLDLSADGWIVGQGKVQLDTVWTALDKLAEHVKAAFAEAETRARVERELAAQREVFGQPSQKASRMASWLWHDRIAEYEAWNDDIGYGRPWSLSPQAYTTATSRRFHKWLTREGMTPLQFNQMMVARLGEDGLKWLSDNHMLIDPSDVLKHYEAEDIIDFSKLAAE